MTVESATKITRTKPNPPTMKEELIQRLRFEAESIGVLRMARDLMTAKIEQGTDLNDSDSFDAIVKKTLKATRERVPID